MEASETPETFEMNVFEAAAGGHDAGIVILEPRIEYVSIEDLLSKLPFNDANEVFREMEEEGEQNNIGEQYNIGVLHEMFAGPATKIASGSFNTVFSKGELGIRISKEPVNIDESDELTELIENQDIWLSLNSVDVTPKLYFYGLLKYKSEYEYKYEIESNYYLIIVNKLYRNNLSDFIRRRPPTIRDVDPEVIDPNKGWYTRLRRRFNVINNNLIVAGAGNISKEALNSLFKILFSYIHIKITKQLKDLVIKTVEKGIFCSDIKTLNIVIDHHFDKLIDMLSEEEFLNNLLADPDIVLNRFIDEAKKIDIKFIDVDYTESNTAGCKKNVSGIVAGFTKELRLYQGVLTRKGERERGENMRALSENFLNIKGSNDIETLSLIVIIFLKLMLIANHLFKDGYNVLYSFFKDDYGPDILQMRQDHVPRVGQSKNTFIQSLLLFLEILFKRTKDVKEVTDEIYQQQFQHYFELGINEITLYDLYWRAVSFNREDKPYIEWMEGKTKKRRVGGKKKTKKKKKKNKKKKKKTKKKKTKKKYYKRNTFKKKKKKGRKQK